MTSTTGESFGSPNVSYASSMPLAATRPRERAATSSIDAVLHAVSQAAGESACRPGSMHPLSRAGGHPSGTAVAGSLVRSTREHRAGSPQSLAQARAPKSASPLDLAPGGVYRAAAVTCGAGGLLHHRFTLTPGHGPGAVCFLWHFPAGHPGSALPTTPPCGARTFLAGTISPGAAARPARPPPGHDTPRYQRITCRAGARCH